MSTKDLVYRILKEERPRSPDEAYKVVNRWDLRPVFYGTRKECAEWIERNGHDEALD